MKILVTGGIGLVGRPVVARLLRHGHTVKVIDRKPDVIIEGAEVVQCDITDFNAVREQMKGMEGVIHLAAIPYPGGATGPDIFKINCNGTYNVFEAAAVEGIRRVVCASSINALGFNYGVKPFDISYFPIDENHPPFTTDPYSFSKQITEEIAAYYWRREGISSVCFRLPAVIEINQNQPPDWADQFIHQYQSTFNTLLALPAGEQASEVNRLWQIYDQLRAERAFEQPWNGEEEPPQSDTDPLAALIRFGPSDFWTLITTEDSAQAFEKALFASYEGSHPLFVCEDNNFTGIRSEDLVRVFFPEAKSRTHVLDGTESLVNTRKAKDLIGFEPELALTKR
jgi:NAD(P)-dependent dehydrogenase (short-subunit alcohol dehydrogenase family)